MQQLHDVCVYAHRSTSALGTALRLPLYNTGGDMIDEDAFYRDSDGRCCVSYVRLIRLRLRLVMRILFHLFF